MGKGYSPLKKGTMLGNVVINRIKKKKKQEEIMNKKRKIENARLNRK